MVEVRTVDAWLVEPRYATAVVGPAYDALQPEERRALAEANPDSFFNVVRSAVDEPGADDDELLDENARSLRRLIDTGRYRARPPALYLYRLEGDGHRQTAVVGDLALRDVPAGRVRAHERTRIAKESELARYLGHLRMHSSPVGLGYRARDEIRALVDVLSRAEPALDFTTGDGLRQQVWAVTGAGDLAALRTAFARVDATYIIDGHHRVAAATRVDGDGHFLAALVPDDELRLFPYHRIVGAPLPTDVSRRLDRLEGWTVEPVAADGAPGADTDGAAPPVPARPEDVVLAVAGRWYRLRRRVPLGARLAAAAVDDELLGPLFDVTDPRRDARLSFVAGRRSAAAVAAVAGERHGAAVLLCAPSLAQVFREADAGRALPPKSTWFEPKLRSGVFVVRR